MNFILASMQTNDDAVTERLTSTPNEPYGQKEFFYTTHTEFANIQINGNKKVLKIILTSSQLMRLYPLNLFPQIQTESKECSSDEQKPRPGYCFDLHIPKKFIDTE